MNIKVGDTVRVVAAEGSFGDYQNGDTGRVVALDTHPGYHVEWLKRTPTPRASGRPCTFLFSREVVLYDDTKPDGMAEWASHYAIAPAALDALRKLLELE